MRRAIIILVVCLLLLGLCTGVALSLAVKWDGVLKRTLAVLVLNADSSEPIPNAIVTFCDTEYEEAQKFPESLTRMDEVEHKRWVERHFSRGNTDASGRCRLDAWFPCGGSKVLLWHTGNLWLDGTVEVRAQGFFPARESLPVLAGARSLAIRGRGPISVHVKLRRAPSE